MDEVENSEDLPDLEVHLYSQLHHERVEPKINNTLKDLNENKVGNVLDCKIGIEKVSEPKKNPFKQIATFEEKFEDCKHKMTTEISPTLKNVMKAPTVKTRRVDLPIPLISNKIYKSKQKSRQKISKAIPNIPMESIATIEIESSDDDNDVVIVPGPTVPIFSVDDSDDNEQQNYVENIAVLAIIETAMDSSDLRIEENNFAKPTLCTYTSDKRVVENSSRCTSPSSVFSADDFIVQQDRQRLKNSYIDNDEIKIVHGKNITLEDHGKPGWIVPDVNGTEEISSSNYRVEQPQFRALDVYESESDIPDSKGRQSSRETIIRTISSTDDEAQYVIEERSIKTKRLYKRRYSDSRKSSETQNGEDKSSDSEIEILNKHLSEADTAFERDKTNWSRKSFKNNIIIPSESESFIAAINYLAQGEINTKDDQNDDENPLRTHEIAERVLERKRKKRTPKSIMPENVLNKKCRKIEKPLEEGKQIFDGMEKILEIVDSNAKHNKNIDNEKDCQLIENVNDNNTFKIDGLTNYDEVACMKTDFEITNESSPLNKSKEQYKFKYLIYNINSKRFSQSQCGIGWNEEQRRFYTSSWKGENFNLKDLWNTMSNNRKLWKVATNDPYANALKSNNKTKCFNCCQFGHKRQRCPYPMKSKVCRICGEDGHLDINCNKKCCLRCGTKTSSFLKSCNSCIFQNRLVCTLCKFRGHSHDNCPDKWRRYHSTIKANVKLNSNVIYNVRVYCYNCGKSGHHGDECKTENNSVGYPKISSRVKSYDKSYEDKPCTNCGNGILCNLLYEPLQCRSIFSLIDLTKPRNYYGRFLDAVGLGYLLRKRRDTSITETIVHPIKKMKTLSSSIDVHEEKRTLEMVSVETDTVKKQSTNHQRNSYVTSGLTQKMNHTGNSTDEKINTEQNTFSTKEIPYLPECPKSSVLIDSDSNYSFSDHFELELPKKDLEMKNISCAKTVSYYEPMGPTPDFIPLESNEKGKNNYKNCNSYMMASTDNENDSKHNSNAKVNKPVVAKIYLTYQRGKYLTLPEGKKLLKRLSDETNITSNLYWSSAGPVITLEGLSADQDEFHRRLQIVFKDINEDVRRNKNEALQQLPKRVGVLIRFLIEHFDMLRSNLGNAIDLHKRLKYLDRQNEPSKSCMKNADKLRRQLNMILIGQAGLQNGKDNLQSILGILKMLQTDYKIEENVPNFLRDQLFHHWKRIFTPFRHENYDEMLQNYKSMNIKNHLVSSENDFALIANTNSIDVSFTEEQKERMNMAQKKQSENAIAKIIDTPGNNLILNTSYMPYVNEQIKQKLDYSNDEKITKTKTWTNFDDSKKLYKKSDSVSTMKNVKTTSHEPPIINPEQRSNVPKNISSSTWESSFKSMLSVISAHNNPPKTNSNSNKPSIFWSRESLVFLNKCFHFAYSRPVLLKLLETAIAKAHGGLLSFNDYMALKKLAIQFEQILEYSKLNRHLM